MTVEDQFIGWGFAVFATAILGLVVMAPLWLVAVRQNARAHARMDPATEALRERWGWETLRGRFGPAVRSIAPVSHRARWQVPDWWRTLVAHGRAPEPEGYGPPPPLAVVDEPTVTAWPAADVNTVRWPGSPVRNPQPVPVVPDLLDAALTVGKVLADANLRDQIRQPASMDATQQMEPIRAEVVQ